jgi:hypothetical protein
MTLFWIKKIKVEVIIIKLAQRRRKKELFLDNFMFLLKNK